MVDRWVPPFVTRRSLLGSLLTGSLAGCVREVEIRQPGPSLEPVSIEQSDRHVIVHVQSTEFNPARCRFSVTGTVTDRRWPTNDIGLSLHIYDGLGEPTASRFQVLESVAQGELVDFEFDSTFDRCDHFVAYEVIGRRL